MLKSDFCYELPPELIAQFPVEPRSASRLLVLQPDSGAIFDAQFADFPQRLHAGDLLVFNNTRVIPARLYGRKTSGGKIEVLIERLLDLRRALVQIRASKPPRPGDRLHFQDDIRAQVLAREGEFFQLKFEVEPPLAEVLARIGHIPLPPYIVRAEEAHDRERYQTIYAQPPGAVAAPTAGLHFDADIFQKLHARGVNRAFLTLHVGAGTFQPVRCEDIAQHRMHKEYLEIDAPTCALIAQAKAQGGRVVAVGTTVVRALETAAQGSAQPAGAPAAYIRPLAGETDIFIYPGYRFKIVDAVLTNFHLPESTLLMLICAFGGTENVLRAYRHAVRLGYRFFSYGDAMFVTHAL
ncbi:MAG TPA: tRNA preQ1(34) S-adenosylmethionine ribosyltransferase-isomerase QueA [Acidiferrobacterales bacterium]|nr:tRNA preQ1(34) S-adenosylmethionine ribosyltransferase-isomerase QueA [Acidiferrobacterales bacterium]